MSALTIWTTKGSRLLRLRPVVDGWQPDLPRPTDVFIAHGRRDPIMEIGFAQRAHRLSNKTAPRSTATSPTAIPATSSYTRVRARAAQLRADERRSRQHSRASHHEKQASSGVRRDSLDAAQGDGISEVVSPSAARSCGRGFDSRRLHRLVERQYGSQQSNRQIPASDSGAAPVRFLQRRSGGVAREDSLELGPRADAELEEHLAQVVLDRARADE
jgi:hypothetical protein